MSLDRVRAEVAAWNREFPDGTRVAVAAVGLALPPGEYETRARAAVSAEGLAVIWLDGACGAIPLAAVTPLSKLISTRERLLQRVERRAGSGMTSQVVTRLGRGDRRPCGLSWLFVELQDAVAARRGHFALQEIGALRPAVVVETLVDRMVERFGGDNTDVLDEPSRAEIRRLGHAALAVLAEEGIRPVGGLAAAMEPRIAHMLGLDRSSRAQGEGSVA